MAAPHLWTSLPSPFRKASTIIKRRHACASTLHKIQDVFFWFCRSVAGTSGLVPSPTSGPLNSASSRESLRKTVFTYFTTFESSRRYSLYFGVDLVDIAFPWYLSIVVFSAEANFIFKTKRCPRRRNAFMRDFPDFVEIYPYASFQFSQTFTIHFNIYRIIFGVVAIFREDFSSVASVNVRFSWRFLWFCCYKLNPPQYVMGTGLGRLGLFSRLSEVTIFITDACMLKLVREGEEDWSDSSPSPLENFLLILNVNLSLIILNWHIFSLELIYFVLLFFFSYL